LEFCRPPIFETAYIIKKIAALDQAIACSKLHFFLTRLMFDSNLCSRSLSNKPVFIDWFTFILFNKSLLIAVICVCLFSLYWAIQHIRWKRQFNQMRIVLVLLGFTVASLVIFFVLDKALLRFLPSDVTTRADAIVVLGRGPLFNETRIERTTELWQAKQAPMIFVSGRGDSVDMMEQLEAKGIPKTVLDGENCSLTTQENAAFTAAILQPQGIHRIVLITDWPHMWRSLLVFRAYGFKVISQTSEIPFYLEGLRANFFLRLREYTALISYGLRGWYFPNPSPELNSPDLQDLLEKAKKYGEQQRL
jgi:uncharacterized SAM-binding protein YcdF (DUF218 family)